MVSASSRRRTSTTILPSQNPGWIARLCSTFGRSSQTRRCGKHFGPWAFGFKFASVRRGRLAALGPVQTLPAELQLSVQLRDLRRDARQRTRRAVTGHLISGQRRKELPRPIALWFHFVGLAIKVPVAS